MTSPAIHPEVADQARTPNGRLALTFKWILLAGGLAGGSLFYLFFSSKLNPALMFAAAHPDVFKEDSFRERLIILAAFLLALLPASRKRIARLLDTVRQPSAKGRRGTALLIFLLSGPLLFGLAAAGHRLMWPYWHDESMCRLQSTFLANGKLSMPALPLPEFFEAPYVFVRQCYAPVYFPGTALLHVPAVWLDLPYVVMPLIIASMILTLLYLVVNELIDGVAGLLAVFLMISLVLFRWLALVEMSHPAGAMFGLAVMWAWLSWRKNHLIRWVVLAAVAAAWYAITRPLDAICVVAPIALAWMWDLRQVPRATRMKYAVLVVMYSMPFLGLQLALDRATTGHWLQTPLELYNRLYLNVKSLGLQTYDPNFSPPTRSQQIKNIYEWGNRGQIQAFTTVKDAARQWFTFRLPLSFAVGLPTLLLTIFLPLALAGLTDRRRWAFAAIVWCYLIGSACFYLFTHQYVLAIAPAIIFTVLLGAHVVERLPTRGVMAVFVPLVIFSLAVYRISLNEQRAFTNNDPLTVMELNYKVLPTKVKLPALVMCRYDSNEISSLQEVVYNWDGVLPDDSPIIRAHDLGDYAEDGQTRLGEGANIRLYQYYAHIQPNRSVYLFDRPHRTIRYLGRITELAAPPGVYAMKGN